MPRTPKRQHANLSRDLIVSRAIDLIEREGEQALSMRRLGAALGVQAMSLYHHVANRDELIEAIAERIYAPTQDVELGGDWRDAAARYSSALRQVAVEHPQAFRLLSLQPLDAPRMGAKRLMNVLIAAGFDRDDAIAIYRAVASLARGYALGETAGFTVGADEIDPDLAFEHGMSALLDGFTPTAA